MNNIIVLKNHFEGRDAIVYKDYVMNGCQFFHKDDLNKICDEYNVSQCQKKQVINALAGIGDYCDTEMLLSFAYRYCNKVKVDDMLRKIILESRDTYTAYSYCKDISNDRDMRQVILDSKNYFYGILYCDNISNDEDMKKMAYSC